MDEKTGLNSAQCDNKPNNSIDQSSGQRSNCPIATHSSPPPVDMEYYTKSSECENPEEEQLFHLMVIDDDSLEEPEIIQKAIEVGISKKPDKGKIGPVSLHDAIVEVNGCNNQNEPISSNLPVRNKDDRSEAGDQTKSKENNRQPTKTISKIPGHDSLILTAGDELETEILLHAKDKTEEHNNNAKENANAVEPVEPVGAPERIFKNEPKNVTSIGSRFFWVSNITQSVKATELKQLISKVGKVLTVKIVTDGKKFYGYVVMENFQDAKECVKILNNTNVEGRKITVSFTRPTVNNVNATKDFSKSKSAELIKTKIGNEATKCSKQKEKRSVRNSSVKALAVPKTRSISSSRRGRSRDPLTSRFVSSVSVYSPRRSRSNERNLFLLREKLEKDHLKRRLIEEQRRNRDIMQRDVRREEKQRELEFKLERERRKLRFERELFERERRETFRLDAEKRKIEKERLEVLQERNKLEEALQKSRTTRKCNEFNVNSTIVKPSQIAKTYDVRGDKMSTDTNYGKNSGSKHARIMIAKDLGPSTNRVAVKADEFNLGKENRGHSKISRRGDDIKDYGRCVPETPSLSNDFDHSTTRKINYADFKRDLHVERKVDHGGRKIEVIDRKYYSDRRNVSGFRKPDFDERKFSSFAHRKYDYGRDAKRDRVEEFPARVPPPRTQWVSSAPVYSEEWKTHLPIRAGTAPVRYHDGTFSAGQNTLPPSYYHSTAATQDYPPYDHCSEANSRKY